MPEAGSASTEDSRFSGEKLREFPADAETGPNVRQAKSSANFRQMRPGVTSFSARSQWTSD